MQNKYMPFVLLGVILYLTGCVNPPHPPGPPNPPAPIDALDVSGLDWRFANVPVDDMFRNPHDSSGSLYWDQTGSLPWPDRGPDHKNIQSALVALFVRDGKIVKCVVDSVPKDKHSKELKNIDPGHHCDVQPQKGERIYWCLCTEEGPDRRTNIAEAPPYKTVALESGTMRGGLWYVAIRYYLSWPYRAIKGLFSGGDES